MRDPSARVRPKRWPGAFVLVTGVAILTLAFNPGTQLNVSGLPYDAATVQAAAGAGLAVLGVGWLAWALTRPEPPTARVAAHEAFTSRQQYEYRAEDLNAQPKPRADARPDLPKPGAPRRLSAEEKVNREIAEIERKIRKAKVMYGTGKLSESGYAQYVEELKEELAVLEAKRVKSDFTPKPKDTIPRRQGTRY